MNRPTVYLGGPILGATKGEANDWRLAMIDDLEAHGIRGISPLRCEPIVGYTYLPVYGDPKFSTARAITAKNWHDVRTCNLILAYFPDVERVSLGTVAEMSWAYALGKPAIVVSQDPRIVDHPVLSHTAGWLVPTLDDALEIATGILADYVGAR